MMPDQVANPSRRPPKSIVILIIAGLLLLFGYKSFKSSISKVGTRYVPTTSETNTPAQSDVTDQNDTSKGDMYPNPPLNRGSDPLTLRFDVTDPTIINEFGLDDYSNYPGKSVKSISHQLSPIPQAKVANSPEVEATSYFYDAMRKGGSVKQAVLEKQISPELLTQTLQTDSESTELRTVPESLKTIYLGTDVTSEIKNVLLTCRKEYGDYMSYRGTNKKYLDKLDEIFPNDLSTFVYDDGNDPNKNEIAYVKNLDNGKKQFVISAVHIYFGSILYQRSGIFDHLKDVDPMKYEKEIRDFSIRKTCYHEFTHILQDSVESVNKGEGKYAYFAKGQTMESATPYLSKFFNTKDLVSTLQLEDAIAEAQAEGLSFEMLMDIYDLSPSQRRALWDHEFGRLKSNRIKINAMASSFVTDFNGGDLLDLSSKLSELPYELKSLNISFEQKKRLGQMMNVSYIAWLGYLNPTTKNEDKKIFDFLKNTHIDY